MKMCRINGELTAFGRNQAMILMLEKAEQPVPEFQVPRSAKQTSVALACILLMSCYHKTQVSIPIPPGLSEAPASFDSPPLTNGFESQADMDGDRAQFEQLSTLPQLGPHFNGQACVSCHNNPESGGGSAIFEHRIGPDEPSDNVASAFLVHSASVPGFAQQEAPPDALNALRRSLNLMGDGFIEQVDDNLLKYIASVNGGQWILVPVLEMPGTTAVGRFGWKDQEATLLSFAADANFNEIGDCNRLLPKPLDAVNCFNSEIEDDETPPADNPAKVEDIDFYASFMRSLKAPPRGVTTQSMRGEAIFNEIGCAWCHIPTLYTKEAPFSGVTGKPQRYKFHPFSDFLLHDIGTGDGIQQGPAPANKVRTSPLWGVGHVNQFLHDGRAYDFPSAIAAHRNEANFARKNYNRLSHAEQREVIAFLGSL